MWLTLVQKKGKAVFPSGDVREGGSLCSLRWNAQCPRSQSPFGKNRLPYTLALSLCQTVALYASSLVKPPQETLFLLCCEMIIKRLGYGKDIIEEIERVCRENKVKKGWIFFIGAFKECEIGYYYQDKKKYKKIKIRKPVEILIGTGNVSLKDNEIFIHAHVVLGDENGKAFGGHLYSGEIFACELFIIPSKGEILKREFDEITGLSLWKE